MSDSKQFAIQLTGRIMDRWEAIQRERMHLLTAREALLIGKEQKAMADAEEPR